MSDIVTLYVTFLSNIWLNSIAAESVLSPINQRIKRNPICVSLFFIIHIMINKNKLIFYVIKVYSIFIYFLSITIYYILVTMYHIYLYFFFNRSIFKLFFESLGKNKNLSVIVNKSY